MNKLDYEWETYTDLEEMFDMIMRSGSKTWPDDDEEFEDEDIESDEYFEDQGE